MQIELTTEVLESILKNYGDQYQEGWERYEWSSETFDIPGLGTVKVVDTFTGGEDSWDVPTHIVFRVTFPDGTERYYRKKGRYQSYQGNDWDGPFSEVSPVSEFITIYE